MYFGRGGGEAGKEGDGISNVEVADNVAKTILALKGSMVRSISEGPTVSRSGTMDGEMGSKGLDPAFRSSSLGVSQPCWRRRRWI